MCTVGKDVAFISRKAEGCVWLFAECRAVVLDELNWLYPPLLL